MKLKKAHSKRIATKLFIAILRIKFTMVHLLQRIDAVGEGWPVGLVDIEYRGRYVEADIIADTDKGISAQCGRSAGCEVYGRKI